MDFDTNQFHLDSVALSFKRLSALNLVTNASTFMNLNRDSGSSISCRPMSNIQTSNRFLSASSLPHSLFTESLKPIKAI